jgi:hypothetical protein
MGSQWAVFVPTLCNARVRKGAAIFWKGTLALKRLNQGER